MADSTDDDLARSLELFNAHLEVEAENEKAARIVAKAERRKTEAANRLRKLNEDADASADDKAAAEATYREAVDELAARTADPFGTAAPSADGDTTADPEQTVDDTPADETTEATTADSDSTAEDNSDATTD